MPRRDCCFRRIGRWLGKYPAAAGVLIVTLNKDARGRACGLALSERTSKLSPTQLRVLELLLEGMSNQEIATELKLAQGTIKNAVSTIMLVLDVHSRSHLSSVFR